MFTSQINNNLNFRNLFVRKRPYEETAYCQFPTHEPVVRMEVVSGIIRQGGNKRIFVNLIGKTKLIFVREMSMF